MIGERVYPYPRYVKDDTKRAGRIGIAAAVAFMHFGMNRVMVCDYSDFHLKLAEKLGLTVCNLSRENFADKAKDYFGISPSLSGKTADIDCWLDVAGAESILDDFIKLGKIESRFVSVAVNNTLRSADHQLPGTRKTDRLVENMNSIEVKLTISEVEQMVYVSDL